jgi:hypothetical protein
MCSSALAIVHLRNTALLLLKSVGHCQCQPLSSNHGSSNSSSTGSSRPGLYQHHDELASSAGQGWIVTDAHPRKAKPGDKRGNGACPWNVNFTANSPLPLQDQAELLSVLLPSYSSSDSDSSSSSPGPPCTLYSIRASDMPVVAYGVALTGQPPSSGKLGEEGMWYRISCNKAKKPGHPLHGKQLWLFKYVVAVYDQEKSVSKRKKT